MGEAISPTSPYFNPRPREGGRLLRPAAFVQRTDFNPRPREGGRLVLCQPVFVYWQFQSTPPRGGATRSSATCPPRSRHFNPRPREGGRLVVRGARRVHIAISIHAPARGGDVFSFPIFPRSVHFNPRPREGGRRASPGSAGSSKTFQSTPPRGGATGQRVHVFHRLIISIHAPARGGDSKDAQFYLRIFDKQVELLRFWGKMRGGCLRNPEKDRRFLGKSLANLPEISGHLDFAGA